MQHPGLWRVAGFHSTVDREKVSLWLKLLCWWPVTQRANRLAREECADLESHDFEQAHTIFSSTARGFDTDTFVFAGLRRYVILEWPDPAWRDSTSADESKTTYLVLHKFKAKRTDLTKPRFLSHSVSLSVIEQMYKRSDFWHLIYALAQVWSRLVAGVAGSNPAKSIDVRLLCLLSVVQVAPRWSVVEKSPTECVILCDVGTPIMRQSRSALGFCGTEKQSTPWCTRCHCLAATGQLRS